MNNEKKLEKIRKAVQIWKANESPPICLWCEIPMTQHIEKDEWDDDYYLLWCDGCLRENLTQNFVDFVQEVIKK